MKNKKLIKNLNTKPKKKNYIKYIKNKIIL